MNVTAKVSKPHNKVHTLSTSRHTADGCAQEIIKGLDLGSGTFCTGKQDGNYANPSNSSTYIACSNQYTYVMPCYPGLVYNAAKDWCDWPSSPATSAPSSCGSQISTSFCRTKANGNYAISSCSSSFIMCSNGLTYITPCPSNLIFNDIFKVCVFPPGSP
ncbi:CPG2 protein, partial [Polypterus senegalus]